MNGCLKALKLNESAADVRSKTRHVAQEKSCVLSFDIFLLSVDEMLSEVHEKFQKIKENTEICRNVCQTLRDFLTFPKPNKLLKTFITQFIISFASVANTEERPSSACASMSIATISTGKIDTRSMINHPRR